MSFRVSALVAAVAVLELSSLAPVAAQPQAPIRPRSSTFGSVFSPNQQFGNNGFGQNQPFVNPIGPQIAGVGGAAGFGYPGQVAFPQSLAGAYGLDPQLPASGIVGTFNNLGHWYGARSGYYGHWYPNGVSNGRGILGYGGGSGGGYGGYGGGSASGGAGGGTIGSRGSIGGTALGVGAAVGSFRR